MTFLYNNSKIEIPEDEITLVNFLKKESKERLELAVIQINDKYIEVEDYSKTMIQENDRVNILYFMAGG